MNYLRDIFNDNRRTRDPDPDRAMISSMLDGKLFVIVSHQADHCPVTDAVMGDVRHFVSGWQNRSAALDEIDRINEEYGYEEISYKVLPVRKAPARCDVKSFYKFMGQVTWPPLGEDVPF